MGSLLETAMARATDGRHSMEIDHNKLLGPVSGAWPLFYHEDEQTRANSVGIPTMKSHIGYCLKAGRQTRGGSNLKRSASEGHTQGSSRICSPEVAARPGGRERIQVTIFHQTPCARLDVFGLVFRARMFALLLLLLAAEASGASGGHRFDTTRQTVQPTVPLDAKHAPSAFVLNLAALANQGAHQAGCSACSRGFPQMLGSSKLMDCSAPSSKWSRGAHFCAAQNRGHQLRGRDRVALLAKDGERDAGERNEAEVRVSATPPVLSV